jgi:hypothetical protein
MDERKTAGDHSVNADHGARPIRRGLENLMIMLCERCFGQIDAAEPLVRLAHMDHVRRDGTVVFRHSYLHSDACRTPRPAAHEQPDHGAWDPARGIRGFRH